MYLVNLWTDKKVLINKYCTKKLLIAERYRFYSLRQEEGVDLISYTVKLKNFSKDYQFGQFLEEALRDKFVWVLDVKILNADFSPRKI